MCGPPAPQAPCCGEGPRRSAMAHGLPTAAPRCPSGLVYRPAWRQNGAMPSIQIKDVPESAHAVLRQRAAAAHQSLQEYLRSRLIAEAGQPTLDEVLDRAGARSGGSVPMAAAARVLRGDRARR